MKHGAIIYGGGTIEHIRPHFAVSAPAYGATARYLAGKLEKDWEVALHLTRMAGGSKGLETNDDLQRSIEAYIKAERTKLVIMSAAICDWQGVRIGQVHGDDKAIGKEHPRLRSVGYVELELRPAPKIIGSIRKNRKDIFLVGFKTTTGASEDEQFARGLDLLKSASCNLVVANDLVNRRNMIVTPEMAAYGTSFEREHTLDTLVSLINARSGLTFTRTQVHPEVSLMAWSESPPPLREVVDYLCEAGAYRAFNGVTVGHYGYRQGPAHFYSSRRKHNYNKIEDRDMVRVLFHNTGAVTAYGFKPSAGVRSQHAILDDEFDCVVHFHCPMLPYAKHRDLIPRREQWAFECGSHECGQNTLAGLKEVVPGIRAVMLDKHGPNITFSSKNGDPKKIIEFIEANFDFKKRAGAPGE